MKNKRVLITKLGLDEHYFGAQLVAHALRNAGMEVIVMGRDITAEGLAKIAVEEDVDVVGISILTGNYNYLLKKAAKELHEKGKGDILIIGGGTIDERDFPALQKAGIARIWGPGAPTSEIVEFIEEYLKKKEAEEGKVKSPS